MASELREFNKSVLVPATATVTLTVEEWNDTMDNLSRISDAFVSPTNPKERRIVSRSKSIRRKILRQVREKGANDARRSQPVQ